MKGALPSDEIAELTRTTPDVHVVRTVRLQVPQLNAERHLVLMRVAQ